MAPHPLPQSWSSPSPPTLQWHPAMAPRPLRQNWPSPPPTIAPCNATVHSPKVGHHPPHNHNHGTLPQWHPTKASSNGTTSTAPCNGTTSAQPKHTTMAPCNGTQHWRHVHSTIARYNGTLQWHHIHSANGTTSTPPKLVVTLPPNHGTLQWHRTTSTQPKHTTMAPCNGTQHWHHVQSTIARYNGALQWHHVLSTIAHHNGTLQWHPAMAPRPLHPAMAFWCHVQCAKVVRRPPPLLEVRTPIAIAIWGKNAQNKCDPRLPWSKLITALITSFISYNFPFFADRRQGSKLHNDG